jgi:hypothetical protein
MRDSVRAMALFFVVSLIMMFWVKIKRMRLEAAV